jgi:hypothetical protein
MILNQVEPLSQKIVELSEYRYLNNVQDVAEYVNGDRSEFWEAVTSDEIVFEGINSEYQVDNDAYNDEADAD